jgi:pSer/pThr/pTyr-binding forkhead associated (FHA) protein
LKLRIVSGGQAGQEIEIPPGGVVVGRDPSCDIVVSDDDASRRHFRVTPGATGAELEDLGSTNGTFLDGQRISGRVTVGPAQKIHLGNLVFEIDEVVGATRIATSPPPAAAGVAPPPPAPPTAPLPAHTPPPGGPRRTPAAERGRPPRRALIGAAAGAIALLLIILAIAGVFSGGDDTSKTPTTATLTVSTATTTTSTTSTTKKTTTSSSSLTPAGSKLKLGKAATIAYKDASHPKKTSTIQLTPTSITKGKISDFKNVKLDDAQKKSTPYYLRVEAKNIGKGDLSKTNPIRVLDGVDDRGQKQAAVLFLLGSFDACPSADSPKSLKHGQSYKSCLTFLIPSGGSLKGAVWTLFDQKTGKSDINWTQ